MEKRVINQMSRSVGLRNLLVHRYASIDWQRVHQSLSGDLNIFSEFVEKLSDKLKL